MELLHGSGDARRLHEGQLLAQLPHQADDAHSKHLPRVNCSLAQGHAEVLLLAEDAVQEGVQVCLGGVAPQTTGCGPVPKGDLFSHLCIK